MFCQFGDKVQILQVQSGQNLYGIGQVGIMSSGSRALSSGSRALSSGSWALSSGSRALSSGSRALSSGYWALSSGSRALSSGSRALSSGSRAHYKFVVLYCLYAIRGGFNMILCPSTLVIRICIFVSYRITYLYLCCYFTNFIDN